MQQECENFEFVQDVDIEFIVSLKNNGTNYGIIFDNTCEENCHSKDFLMLRRQKDIVD